MSLSDQVLLGLETNLSESASTSMPTGELATLGLAVSSLLPAFRKITQTTQADMKGSCCLANAEAGDALKCRKTAISGEYPKGRTELSGSQLENMELSRQACSAIKENADETEKCPDYG